MLKVFSNSHKFQQVDKVFFSVYNDGNASRFIYFAPGNESEDITMKITLDLESNMITVPKNFFKNIDKNNELIKKMGGEPIKALDVIRKSFDVAMSDTDKYLHTKD